VQFSMTEQDTQDRGAHGGVVNLLRMAKTQCGAALAFAALRKADGHFAIATFPALTPDSAWDIEAIDELVHQAWSDPHLTGGKVLVRSGRVVAGRWPGDGAFVKLAVAPLSDLGSVDRPWGLLCVADPLLGHFEQERLDLLGTMAVRLTSYLRARQEILEELDATRDAGGSSLQGTRPPTFEEELPGRVATAAAPPSPPPAGPGRQGEDPFELLLRRKAEVIDEILNKGSFEAGLGTGPADVRAPAPAGPGAGEPGGTGEHSDGEREEPEAAVNQPTAAGAGEPVGATAEWRSAVRAPAGAGPGARGSEDRGSEDRGFEDGSLEDRGLEDGGLEDGGTLATSEVLGSMLRPDAVTGLVGLPSVLGRLGEALGTLKGSGGSVAVVLLELVPEIRALVPDTVLTTVADRLREHVRGNDVVGRVGRATFAVVASLRTGPVDAPVIERRLLDAVGGALASLPGNFRVRSALATSTPDSTTGPEDLLRHVAAQLSFA